MFGTQITLVKDRLASAVEQEQLYLCVHGASFRDVHNLHAEIHTNGLFRFHIRSHHTSVHQLVDVAMEEDMVAE